MPADYGTFLDCLLDLDYEVLRSSKMPVELSRFLTKANNAANISILLSERYHQNEVEIRDGSKVFLALLSENQQVLENTQRFLMNVVFRNQDINFDCFYELLASYVMLVLSTKTSKGEHTTDVVEDLKVLILAFKPSKDLNYEAEEEFLLKLSSRLLAQSRDAHSEGSAQGDMILDILGSVLTNFSSNAKSLPILSNKKKLSKRLYKWLRRNMKSLGIFEVPAASQAGHIDNEDAGEGGDHGNNLFILDTSGNSAADEQIVVDGDGDGADFDATPTETEAKKNGVAEDKSKGDDVATAINIDVARTPTRTRKSKRGESDVSTLKEDGFLSPKKDESPSKRKKKGANTDEVSPQKPTGSTKEQTSPTSASASNDNDVEAIATNVSAKKPAPKSAKKNRTKQRKSIDNDDFEIASERSDTAPKSNKKSEANEDYRSEDEAGEKDDIVPPLMAQLLPQTPPGRRTRSMSGSSFETPNRSSTPQVGARRSARKRASSISSVESANVSVVSTSTPLRRSARKAPKLTRMNIS